MRHLNDIDVSDALWVAWADSKGDGRERWTALNVYYFPDGINGGGRRWLAEAIGKSEVRGEVDKVRRLASSSLERALRLFDESDLGVIVRETAREYAEEHGLAARQIDRQQVPESDREALLWLYGRADGGLAIREVAADLGVGESSIRMAIRDDRDVRIPLRALLPFIDRKAFQAASMKEAARG